MHQERTTYYLLAYQPTNTATDGKFRRVSVKVKRPRVTVRARPGYVAARQP
jgi:Ca-activated chloride channel family protein